MSVNESCGRFRFVLDMNGDFAFTISDVWQMLQFAWLLPAKAVVGYVHAIPHLAAFFEISCESGEGWGGAVFSFLVWCVVLLIAYVCVVIRNENIRVAKMGLTEPEERK